MRHIVLRRRKPEGYWTPERIKAVWDMYVDGKPFEEIAQEFDTTIAAVQRQVYDYKRKQ